MKIRFNKTITVDLDDSINDKTYHRNDVVEVSHIEPISKEFYYLTLSDGNVLVDVRRDWFDKVV